MKGGATNMAKVEQKQTIVNEIKEAIEGAQSIVLVDYRGLTVEQDTELRKSMREADINYKVFKNTMMRFAFEGTEFESLSQHLEGPSAIAISKTDATAPAKVASDIAKKYPKLEFKAGVVEGQYYDNDGIQKIASIPSREELLGKLLGSIQSPITNFARVLNQIAEKNGSEVAAE
jgi:large subunit ribosomal protein L10